MTLPLLIPPATIRDSAAVRALERILLGGIEQVGAARRSRGLGRGRPESRPAVTWRSRLAQHQVSDYSIPLTTEPEAVVSPRAGGPALIPPPALYGGTLLVSLLLNRLFPLPFLPRRLNRVLGVVLVGAGQGLLATSVMALRRAGNTPRPDKPVIELVEEGPYRYSRNPIYLAMGLIYAGIGALANSRWSVLLLPAVIASLNHGMIDREEHYLSERFGDRYRRYKERVRRWF